MLWKLPDQRPLVSVRKTITHKLFRTSSRQFCPEVICKKQVQHPSKVNHEQYNGNKLHKQNGGGGGNITGLVNPSLRPLAVVSRTVYYSRSPPLAGATKHCGRFRIPSSSRFQRLAAAGTIHLSVYHPSFSTSLRSDTKVQQFHRQLKDCSWLRGKPGQKKLILQPGESGLVSVVNNKSIPFQHL